MLALVVAITALIIPSAVPILVIVPPFLIANVTSLGTTRLFKLPSSTVFAGTIRLYLSRFLRLASMKATETQYATYPLVLPINLLSLATTAVKAAITASFDRCSSAFQP